MKNVCGSGPKLAPKSSSPNGTLDGHLRHSRFVGVREDKEAGNVAREPGN
jgi:hypothetical protein